MDVLASQRFGILSLLLVVGAAYPRRDGVRQRRRTWQEEKR